MQTLLLDKETVRNTSSTFIEIISLSYKYSHAIAWRCSENIAEEVKNTGLYDQTDKDLTMKMGEKEHKQQLGKSWKSKGK